VELLHREKSKFIAPDMWSPNSPDIKHVEYCIWGAMQERDYHTPIQDMADLWQKVMSTSAASS